MKDEKKTENGGEVLSDKNQDSKSSSFILHPSALKILLWDIDGTLMSSAVHGAFKKYFAPVMREIYGSAGALAQLQVAGMTDTQIFYEALKGEGFTPEKILAPIAKLLPVFKEAMTRVVGETEKPYELKPGVREILEATSANPRFTNALLTGNLSVAAEIKLRYFDLWKYFNGAPNVFGEASCDRGDFGKIAVARAEAFLGARLDAEQFVVVGDTPKDIRAARAFGARVVSVATGSQTPRAELEKFKPDALLDDLSDTKEVLRVFETV